MMQIDVQDLVFSYGGADVLQGVSFCADKGERIAVLGPNGVGKSTLFRCLLGFLEPKRGCVKIAGRWRRSWPISRSRTTRSSTIRCSRAS